VRWVAVTVLLAVAIAGTLWVPLYDRSTPKLGPFPFFYAYQLIWIPVSAAVCWVCYLLLRRRPGTRAGTRRGGGQS
jgi:threonine/homoserine efflux transporter RhtA